MRVALDIDDDLADSLKDQARLLGKRFEQVLNDALRRGISLSAEDAPMPRYRVIPNRSGLAPGADPLRLNHLNDELST